MMPLYIVDCHAAEECHETRSKTGKENELNDAIHLNIERVASNATTKCVVSVYVDQYDRLNEEE